MARLVDKKKKKEWQNILNALIQYYPCHKLYEPKKKPCTTMHTSSVMNCIIFMSHGKKPCKTTHISSVMNCIISSNCFGHCLRVLRLYCIYIYKQQLL